MAPRSILWAIGGGRTSKPTRQRNVVKLLVSLLVAGAFSGLVGLGGAAASGPASPALQQAPGPTSLNYRYYDFFNVPYGEWWDYRYSVYGDLPMNAEGFNATSIVDGVGPPHKPPDPDH